MGFFQGLLGNLQEVDKNSLWQQYKQYLIPGEEIETGYKLVRDTVILTNFRILDFDKQGATGKKVHLHSIHLDAIVEVSCETAGFGFDDSEITIGFITTPYHRSNELSLAHKTFEFPKKLDVAPLYVLFETLAQQNLRRINS
jgi:hypothetical protein